MRRAGQPHLVLALALAPVVLCAAGCDDPITEVVVVLTSDLQPADADSIQISSIEGNGSPPAFSQCTLQSSFLDFPLTAGFTSGGHTTMFSTTIQLTKGVNTFPAPIVMARTVFGIPFTPGQIRMLVVPMKAACKCVGTSCPNPGTNPDCDAIENPETVEFDPIGLPPSVNRGNSCGGATIFGGTPIRAPADSGTEPVERARSRLTVARRRRTIAAWRFEI